MFNFVDRWIDSFEGRATPGLSYEQTLELAKANLLSVIGNYKKIVFTGNVDFPVIQKIYNDFCEQSMADGFVAVEMFSADVDKVQICPGADLNSTPSTLAKVSDCDAVVLIEQRGKSLFAEINKTVSTLQDLGKEVLGFIVV